MNYVFFYHFLVSLFYRYSVCLLFYLKILCPFYCLYLCWYIVIVIHTDLCRLYLCWYIVIVIHTDLICSVSLPSLTAVIKKIGVCSRLIYERQIFSMRNLSFYVYPLTFSELFLCGTFTLVSLDSTEMTIVYFI